MSSPRRRRRSNSGSRRSPSPRDGLSKEPEYGRGVRHDEAGDGGVDRGSCLSVISFLQIHAKTKPKTGSPRFARSTRAHALTHRHPSQTSLSPYSLCHHTHPSPSKSCHHSLPALEVDVDARAAVARQAVERPAANTQNKTRRKGEPNLFESVWACARKAVVSAHRLLFGVFVARWPVFHWPWFGSGQSRSQPCQNSPCFAHSLTLMMCGSSVLRDRVRVREGEETGERGGVQRSKRCAATHRTSTPTRRPTT